MLIAMFAPPPVAPAPPWLEQPSQQELAIARAKYASLDQVEAALRMTCYVQADGRLAACDGDDALKRLSGRYRLDRDRYTAPSVVVTATLPKLYDQPARKIHEPDRAELKAMGGSGRVSLLCRVDESGAVSECEPREGAPTPSRQAIESGVKAAGLYRFTPASLRGVPVSAYVGLTIPFGDEPFVITRPNWLRKPTGEQLSRAYPAEAWRAGLSGTTAIQCRVLSSGAVTGCKAISETPAGAGFAEAALQLAPLFVMKPQTLNGQPVEDGVVTIPIHFASDGPHSEPAAQVQTISMMSWAPLLAAPSAAQVAAVFPADAAARRQFGRAVMLCGVEPSGKLADCETRMNDPKGAGFDAAAKRLTPLFRVNVGAMPKAQLEALRVSIAFDFSARALAADPDRFIRQVDWVRAFDAQTAVAAYPPQAVAAGVLNGGATVECRLDAEGKLTACVAVAESTPDLGFAAAAVAVASVMQANLWTRDGEPTAGAKVRMPLKLVYSGERSAPTGAP